jgi:hypothetical protein
MNSLVFCFVLLSVFAGSRSSAYPTAGTSGTCEQSLDGQDPTFGNYGDLLCQPNSAIEQGDLISRDTIITDLFQNYTNTIYLVNYSVRRANLLNFGHYHAFATLIVIENNDDNSASVKVEITNQAESATRMFLEIYGISLNQETKIIRNVKTSPQMVPEQV